MPSYSFVMVPVPEEFVNDVVQLVARLNLQRGFGGSSNPWDAPAIERFFLEANEETRTLLSVVARGSLAGKRVTEQIAADFMQVGMAEASKILRGMNASLRQAQRAQLVQVDVVSEPLPSGRMREKRFFTMEREIAQMVRAAERAEKALEPHPLHGAPSGSR
jgi:hypothetical protein